MSEEREPIDAILEPAIDEARIAATWQRIRQARGGRRSFAINRWMFGAALAAAAAVAFYAAWPATPAGPLTSDGVTLAAGTVFDAPAPRVVALDDRSELALAPGARLEVLTNESDRFVTQLQHGRARFDVHPGGPRRWEVETGLATVEVVGTAFAVEADAQRVVVEVERGVVMVRGERVPNRVARLTAGEHIIIEPGVKTADAARLGGSAAVSAPGSGSAPASAASGAAPATAGGAMAGGSASASGTATAGGAMAGGSASASGTATAGGSTAGGSASASGTATAGGAMAGGSASASGTATAGGSTVGGSTAGGSTAGGSTAGGSTAGGSTASMAGASGNGAAGTGTSSGGASPTAKAGHSTAHGAATSATRSDAHAAKKQPRAAQADAAAVAAPRTHSVSEALDDADQRRATGDPAGAAAVLERALATAHRDEAAGMAAFTLGRIYLEDLRAPDRAASAFEQMIAIGAPLGLLEDAHARQIEALVRARRTDDATAALVTYDRLYPRGAHHAAVHALFTR